MNDLVRLCPLCDGSQCVRIGERKGERCDYCVEGQVLTMDGELLASLIDKYIGGRVSQPE